MRISQSKYGEDSKCCAIVNTAENSPVDDLRDAHMDSSFLHCIYMHVHRVSVWVEGKIGWCVVCETNNSVWRYVFLDWGKGPCFIRTYECR